MEKRVSRNLFVGIIARELLIICLLNVAIESRVARIKARVAELTGGMQHTEQTKA